MIQAETILLATPQRTGRLLARAPTPIMQPVMVCVVDTGMPSQVAANSVIEPPVSAQKPCMGVRRVIFDAHRFYDAPAADSVPSAIASWQVITTQNGTWNSAPRYPCEYSSTAMMPIVF